MSAETNKAIIRRLWEEVWNQGNLSVCDEIFDAAYEKGFAPVLRAAFPDLHFTIEDMIAEDDKVVTRHTMTGTHQGEFMGIAPTGRPIEFTVIDILRLDQGKIVEHWAVQDRLALMQQLGLLPTPDRP